MWPPLKDEERAGYAKAGEGLNAPVKDGPLLHECRCVGSGGKAGQNGPHEQSSSYVHGIRTKIPLADVPVQAAQHKSSFQCPIPSAQH